MYHTYIYGGLSGPSFPEGVVAQYDMQNVSEGQLLDSSGNERHRTLGANAPTQIPTGFAFNGTSQYIDITSLYTSVVDGVNGPWSFLIVVRNAGEITGNKPVLGTGAGDRSGMMNFVSITNNLRLMVGSVYIQTATSLGTWYAAMGRYQAGTPSDLWLNGAQKISTASPAVGSSINVIRFGIGAFTGADGVQEGYYVLWNRKLSDEEMVSAYETVKELLASRETGSILLP